MVPRFLAKALNCRLVREPGEAARVVEELPHRRSPSSSQKTRESLLDLVVESEAALADELEHDGRDERLRNARNAETISEAHSAPRFERRCARSKAPRAGPVAHERDDARRALRAHVLEHRLDVRLQGPYGSLIVACTAAGEQCEQHGRRCEAAPIQRQDVKGAVAMSGAAGQIPRLCGRCPST